MTKAYPKTLDGIGREIRRREAAYSDADLGDAWLLAFMRSWCAANVTTLESRDPWCGADSLVGMFAADSWHRTLRWDDRLAAGHRVRGAYATPLREFYGERKAERRARSEEATAEADAAERQADAKGKDPS